MKYPLFFKLGKKEKKKNTAGRLLNKNAGRLGTMENLWHRDLSEVLNNLLFAAW